MRKRTLILIVSGCILTSAAISAYSHYSQNNARALFSKRLAEIGGVETIVFGGTQYEVTHGIIEANNARISPRIRLHVLRLAYAQELARRSPLLDLSGTDPIALQNNTESLKLAIARLASEQTSIASARLISSLYPVAFLSALSVVESSRLAFLQSGSDTDEKQYEVALVRAAAAGQRDAAAFQEAYATATKAAASGSLSTFSGTIATVAARSSIVAIRWRFDDLQRRIKKRFKCLDGRISSCDPRELAEPHLPSIHMTPDVRSSHIADLVASAAPASFESQYDEVVLASSTCVAMLPGPYHFYVKKSGYETLFAPPKFLGDIFFTRTSTADGPVHEYLRDTHGIQFAVVNPMQYYQCPQIASDLSEMRAIEATAALARTYPLLAATQRATFLFSDGGLRQDYALDYLSAVLSSPDIQKSPAYEVARTVSLMFSDNSAGLDYVVGMIAETSDADVRMFASGIPFDISAKTLFLTHSAFPSLFLADNGSVSDRSIQLTVHDTGNFQRLLQQYTTYTSLRSSIPDSILIRDIRAFYDFEDRGY